MPFVRGNAGQKKITKANTLTVHMCVSPIESTKQKSTKKNKKTKQETEAEKKNANERREREKICGVKNVNAMKHACHK